MKVGDVMTRRVRTCQPAHSVETVMHTLWERDLGALPVVNEIGEPIAVITDRDVAVAAYTQGKALSQIPVHCAMSKVVHTAHISDSLAAAERTMRTHQVRRLPVVDESSRLVGVLSLNDIARSRTASATASPGEGTDIVHTLVAIAKPRRSAETEPRDLEDADPKREATEARQAMPAVAARQTPSQVRALGEPSPKRPRAGRGRQ